MTRDIGEGEGEEQRGRGIEGTRMSVRNMLREKKKQYWVKHQRMARKRGWAVTHTAKKPSTTGKRAGHAEGGCL